MAIPAAERYECADQIALRVSEWRAGLRHRKSVLLLTAPESSTPKWLSRPFRRATENKTTPDRDRMFPTQGVLLARDELADDSLDGSFGRLAGADANHVGQRGHEDLAIAHLARPGAVHDRVDHGSEVFV
jgi:hypothetical protein